MSFKNIISVQCTEDSNLLNVKREIDEYELNMNRTQKKMYSPYGVLPVSFFHVFFWKLFFMYYCCGRSLQSFFISYSYISAFLSSGPFWFRFTLILSLSAFFSLVEKRSRFFSLVAFVLVYLISSCQCDNFCYYFLLSWIVA